ncbi:RING finger protein 207-like isoform X1 [Amphiura filiformis]
MRCLRGRSQDGSMSCPFCGCFSVLEPGADIPPEDTLLSFLVKSSEDDVAFCANCDKTSSTMFFCNTCNQPLCSACKEETHRARMFASHTIVTLNKRHNEQHKKCAEHNEDYIMFSVDKSKLLCIKCFRDIDKEDRADCVDLETAYTQGCQKLQERSNTIQELQSSVHNAIILFQALTQEVKTNAEEERKAIGALYSLIEEKIRETKADLLREVERQYQEKEKAFKEQLPTLAALLPTLHTTLAICALFSNSSNMFEFLDLSASLMERLSAIVDHPHQLSPQQSSKICSNFEEQFAKCLQPLLGCGDSSCQSVHNSHPCSKRSKDSSPYVSHHVAHQFSQQATYIQTHRRMVKAAGNRQSKIMGSGPFVEHCKAFEANYKLIHHRIQKMKEQVQELHRDITRRKCLSKKEAVTDIVDECNQVDIQINTQMATLEHMKIVFQRLWQETLERVSREQGVYQTQLNEMGRLKQENSHLETIARQIAPFISSITAVTQRIDPSRRDSEPEDGLHAVMEQISTILPDAPLRVDVIRINEEEREAALQQAHCKPSKLEDDLIRTKEMLRSHHKSPVMERKHTDITSDNEITPEEVDTKHRTKPTGASLTPTGASFTPTGACLSPTGASLMSTGANLTPIDASLTPVDACEILSNTKCTQDQNSAARDLTKEKFITEGSNGQVQWTDEVQLDEVELKLTGANRNIKEVIPSLQQLREASETGLCDIRRKSTETCKDLSPEHGKITNGFDCDTVETIRLKSKPDKKVTPQRIKVTVTVDESKSGVGDEKG